MHRLDPILAAVLLIHSLASAWDADQVADIARDLAAQRDLGCINLVHPDDAAMSQHELLRTIKALQGGRGGSQGGREGSLMSMRVLTFLQRGSGIRWSRCTQVLYVLMAWLPNARQQFAQFAAHALVKNPVWLVLLPDGLSHQDFIGQAFLPFPARILLATATPDGADLHQAWRVEPGLPLRVQAYATWTPQQGLSCLRIVCSFSLRLDLEGVPLRAATKDDMPLSESIFNPDGSLGIGGYFADIYYELAVQLNMTPVVLPAPENVTGSATDGVWNGLIGMMVRNEIDMAVGPISLHLSVLEVTDFVRPLLRTNYQVFFKQDGTVVEWDAFLRPFGKFVWRLIILWFLVAAFALDYFYRIGMRCGQERRIYAWEFSKLNAFFTFFRAFCQQGCNLVPKSLSCRGLYLTGYLTSTILVTAYSAALISKLTLQEPLRPFDSLETFLKDGSYTLTAIAASTDYTYFSEATDTTLKDIYQRMMKRVPEDQLPMGKEEGLENVCARTKTALFITHAVTQIAAREMELTRHCRVLCFRNPLGTVFLTIGIRKHMPFSRTINQQLQIMAERGLLKRLQRKEWPLTSGTGTEVATPQVEIGQVAMIYGVLLIGLTMALFTLVAEMWSVHPRGAALLRWARSRSGLDANGAVTAVFLFALTGVIITLVVGLL